MEAFPLNTSGGTAGAEIERICLDNELVITTWSPIHLRTRLKELYWKDGKAAVSAMTFWEDSLRYLYLPRLKNKESLSKAIQTGAGSKDFFGTAYGQDGDKYTGFQVGEGNVQFDDTLLLIEASAAIEYAAAIEREKRKKDDTDAGSTGGGTATGGDAGGSAGGGSTSGGSETSGGGSAAGTGPMPASKPKSFHGSIQVKPNASKVHLVQIAEEIISILAADPNASLNITLEINAEFPAGASDQIKRAVSENATALGFKSKVWE